MQQSRTKIRKALVAVLNGRTDAKENVVDQRTLPNWYENTPAINVYLKSEEISELCSSPRTLKRELLLDVQIVVSAKEESIAADKMEAIMEQVEDLIEMDDSLGGNVEDIILTGNEVESDPGGEEPVLAARMSWKAIYLTGAPRTRKGQRADGDFKGANVDYQIKPLDDAEVEATDTINV